MTAIWVSLLGAASYLVLAGSTDLDEVAVAVVLGVLAAAWHAAVLRVEARCFALEGAGLVEIGRSLVKVPGATAAVGRRLAGALLHGAAGRQADVPFELGRQGLPAEAGRRAVVLLATSLAPDAYVLRIPSNEGMITYHALTERTPGGDRRYPA